MEVEEGMLDLVYLWDASINSSMSGWQSHTVCYNPTMSMGFKVCSGLYREAGVGLYRETGECCTSLGTVAGVHYLKVWVLENIMSKFIVKTVVCSCEWTGAVC